MHSDDISFRDLFVPLTARKVALFIIGIGLLVFSSMLFNGFVMDDRTFLVSNPQIRSWSLSSLFGPSMFNSNGHYRPVPALYFTFVFNLFQGNLPFLHLAQLGIHVANTILFFFFLRRFINKKLAFFLSLIFLTHPVQVESVSYIAASDNPLFFLFGILSLHLSLKSKQSPVRLATIYLLLFFSVLTKETGFLFVLLSSWLLFRSGQRKAAVWGVISVISLYLFMRLGLFHIPFIKPQAATVTRIAPPARLMTVPAIAVYYLKTLLFPVRMAVDQQWAVTQMSFDGFFLPLFIAMVLFIVSMAPAILFFRQDKARFWGYLFFSIWFWSGMAAHFQIVPLDATVADRWMYLPLAGLLGMTGIALHTVSRKKIISVLLLIAIVLFSLRTFVRNLDWVDAYTLYTRDSRIETNYDMENNLGLEYFSRGDYRQAITHYRKSAELLPYDATFANLAQTYDRVGDLKNARKYYREAIDTANISPAIHPLIEKAANERLAYVSLRLDPPEKALEHIRESLIRYPDSVNLWADLAIAWQRLGRKDEALAAAGKAKQLLPNEATQQLYDRIMQDQAN